MRSLLLALALVAAADASDVLLIGGERFPQTDILDARAVADGGGQPAILVTLTPGAAKRLETLTAALVGEPVPITFEGRVLMEPTVREVIASGSLEISGVASFEAAAALAQQISGKPPLPESLDE